MMKEKTSCTKSEANVPVSSLPLFSQNSSIDIPPGSLNDDLLVRGTITESIKRSSKSRQQVADEMSKYLGIPVTARMITSFTTQTKELHRWPGAWDRAFCVAVNDMRLLFCRVELAGFQVIDAVESDLLELGRETLRQKRAAEKAALLERRLQGAEL